MRVSKGAQARQGKGRWMTDEMLAAHDRELLLRKRKDVRDQVVSQVMPVLKQEEDESRGRIDDYIAKEWEAREKIFRPDEEQVEGFFNILQLLLAVPARVLIEKFGWKPIPKDGEYDMRNRLVKFSDYMVDELNNTLFNDTGDIKRYCDETYEKYGVRFVRDYEGEADDGKE